MSRYKVETIGDDLVVTLQENGPPPLRAISFLQFDRREQRDAELLMEINGDKILIWVEGKRRRNGPKDSL